MGVPFSTSKHHATPCLSQSHLALTPTYSGSVSNDPLDLEFQILNAFTTDAFGGNPAVVIFLKDEMPPDDLLERINANFNQPIVVYVSPPTSTSPPKEGSAVFGLRWFGPRNEVHICGHGTREFVCFSTHKNWLTVVCKIASRCRRGDIPAA
jgi:PhzF family phenazine biosynthesis protein